MTALSVLLPSPRLNPHNGEVEFFDFLAGWLLPDESIVESIAWEPDLFLDLKSLRAGSAKRAYRPDLRYEPGPSRRRELAMALGVTSTHLPKFIYLELSSADRYPNRCLLPQRVLRTNRRRRRRSGQDYISPDKYFVYKQDRINIARLQHGMAVALLKWSDQIEILAQPKQLDVLIAVELAVWLKRQAAPIVSPS